MVSGTEGGGTKVASMQCRISIAYFCVLKLVLLGTYNLHHSFFRERGVAAKKAKVVESGVSPRKLRTGESTQM